MRTRRTVLLSLAGAAAVSLHRATAADAVFPGRATDDTPIATVIAGHPPVLDFGDGLKIACDKSAFLTLWEGKTFWLTFGAGRATFHERAMGEAVLYASGAMKLLLMTLAFTPERLVRENGGWRLKMQNVGNYVLGDLALPGKPYWPITDADFAADGFRGAGGTDSSGLNKPPPAAGGTPSDTPGWDPVLTGKEIDAYTTYVVLKKNLSLEDVRARAQLLMR
jgi:hypothetical protein